MKKRRKTVGRLPPSVINSGDRALELIGLIRQGDLSGNQIELRLEFLDLSVDGVTFIGLGTHNRAEALRTLTWVNEELRSFQANTTARVAS